MWHFIHVKWFYWDPNQRRRQNVNKISCLVWNLNFHYINKSPKNVQFTIKCNLLYFILTNFHFRLTDKILCKNLKANSQLILNHLPVVPCMWILNRPFCRVCMNIMNVSGDFVDDASDVVRCSMPVLVTPSISSTRKNSSKFNQIFLSVLQIFSTLSTNIINQSAVSSECYGSLWKL